MRWDQSPFESLIGKRVEAVFVADSNLKVVADDGPHYYKVDGD